jgi:uncharacterized membrane protein YdbT with pleckstrin-like domain
MVEGWLTEGERLIKIYKKCRYAYLHIYVLVIIFAIIQAAFYGTLTDFFQVRVLAFLPLVIAAVLLLLAETLLFTRRLYITNKGITKRAGIISRHISTMDFEDVRHVGVKQGIIARIFNYGELLISIYAEPKSGEGGKSTEAVVSFILTNPFDAKRLIEETIRRREYYIIPKVERKGTKKKSTTFPHPEDSGQAS